MKASVAHAEHTSHAKFSNLTRFADLLKDSMTTKRAPTPDQGRRNSTQPPDVEAPGPNKDVIHNRRSSSTRYTEKMIQMFMPSNRSSVRAIGFNDLPVEILQNVFLNLDIVTLLRIRRVCRLWKDLVPGDSPLLAEELFLKPSHNLYAYSFTCTAFDFDFEINVHSLPERGPMSRMQPTFIEGLSLTRRCLGLIRIGSEFIFHPIICDFNNYLQGDEQGKSKLILEDLNTIEPTHWSNMLISMPPITELRLSRTIGRKCKTMCVIKAENGVRLGDVVNTLSNCEIVGKCDIMARLWSSKLWQALGRGSRRQPDVKEHQRRRTSNINNLPVEILQGIFVCLDMWTLLRCRNVCRL
ncbi:hypothetical protein DE146DRAFT_683465, partial [Phaeosphaeria sp. MPI-PUGE-AT-0046c]